MGQLGAGVPDQYPRLGAVRRAQEEEGQQELGAAVEKYLCNKYA